MEEICKQEQIALERIRNTNYAPQAVPVKKTVKKPIVSPFNWKANRLPRPIWGIIISFSDATTLIKLEKLCKMLYLLINPLCSCSKKIGHADCQSTWRVFCEINSNLSCKVLKRKFAEECTVMVITKHLKIVKDLSCSQNLHDWEPHPQNPNIIRCCCCAKGAKRSDFCAGVCELHSKICTSENLKYSICRNHICLTCKLPQISNSLSVIKQILSTCAHFTLSPQIKIIFSK